MSLCWTCHFPVGSPPRSLSYGEAGCWKATHGRSCWASIFALGMLTKWTFPAFLVFPIGYALYASRDRKRSLLHLFDAVLIGTPAVFFWYLPNLKSLAERFALTSGTGTALENDPTALHLQGWLYYPRCLSSYYLYLPLTVLFVAGFILWLRGPGSDREGASLVWWWLGGSCLLLTLLDAKDPRYMMPLAAPVAILLVSFWRHRPAFLWAIVRGGISPVPARFIQRSWSTGQIGGI